MQEAGLRAKKSKVEELKKAAAKLKEKLPPKVFFVEAMTITGFALLNDVFDLLLIGSSVFLTCSSTSGSSLSSDLQWGQSFLTSLWAIAMFIAGAIIWGWISRSIKRGIVPAALLV